MKRILLFGAGLLGLAGCVKDTGPDDQCLPPGPRPVYIVLQDSVTGRNLLEAPARYRPDSIQNVYPNGTSTPARIDTIEGERAVVAYLPTPSGCGGTDTKFGSWVRLLIRLDATTTDSLAIDRPAVDSFEYRYNGRRQTPSRPDPIYGRIRLTVRR